jgi:predicted dehydrogenase
LTVYKADQAPIHVLIVGAGAIGALWDTPGDLVVRTHAHAVTNHPGLTLAGFVEPDPDRATNAVDRWGGQAWGCFEAALRDLHAQDDCLYILPVIASPDVTHAPLLSFLLRHSWPKVCGVVVEKPLASSVADAQALAAQAQAIHLPLWVNYPRAFLPPYVALKETCQALGAWRQGTLRYGKGLWHNGSHGLQLWQMLTGVGSPDHYDVSFTVLETFHDWPEAARDPTLSGRLLLTPRRGLASHQEACWLMLDAVPADRGVTVFELDLMFEGGRVQILDNGQHLVQWRVGPQPLSPQHQYFVPEAETRVDLSCALAGVYQQVVSDVFGTQPPDLPASAPWVALTAWLSVIRPSPLTLRLPTRTPSSTGNPPALT